MDLEGVGERRMEASSAAVFAVSACFQRGEALGASTAEDLLNMVATAFPWEYGASKGVREGYTLRQHTLMVLRQYDTYFGWKGLPAGIDRGLFRLILALHDVGTPHAIRETGDKRNQHRYTTAIVRQTLETLGCPQEDVSLATAVVSDDIIGAYVRGRLTGAAATARIVALAESAGRDLSQFLDLLLTYYQVDAGSYTLDAGGLRSLDHLFEFDRKNRTMRLALPIDAKVGCLAAYARESPHSIWLTNNGWHDVPEDGLKTWVREDAGRLLDGPMVGHTFSYRYCAERHTYQVRLSAQLPEAMYSPRSIFLHDHGWHVVHEMDLLWWVKDRISELNSGKILHGRAFRYRRNAASGAYEIRLARGLDHALYCP